MPQKRTEYFKPLLDHPAWIEHQFLSGIRDSRKTGRLWGMMRGVAGVRKSLDQGYNVEVLREFKKRFCRKRPALFKSGQWHFHQDNAPVHNSILVTDYLTKMGIKTLPHPPYSPDLAPCDFWLFPTYWNYVFLITDCFFHMCLLLKSDLCVKLQNTISKMILSQRFVYI